MVPARSYGVTFFFVGLVNYNCSTYCGVSPRVRVVKEKKGKRNGMENCSSTSNPWLGCLDRKSDYCRRSPGEHEHGNRPAAVYSGGGGVPGRERGNAV